jgi:hypothetical protein
MSGVGLGCGGVQAVKGTAGGGPPWTPASRANLAFWFRGDAGITPNGGDAASWLDFRGSGLTVAQVTPANQPLIVASGSLNSQPCVRFTRTNSDILTVASGAPSQKTAHSIFVVAVFNTLHSAFQGLCGIGNNVKSSGVGATVGPVSWFGGASLVTPAGAALVTATPYALGKVVQAESAGTSVTQGYRNGVTDGSSASNAYDVSTAFNIGSYDTSGANSCTADIYEIVGYGDAMNGADITQLHAYFKVRYPSLP